MPRVGGFIPYRWRSAGGTVTGRPDSGAVLGATTRSVDRPARSGDASALVDSEPLSLLTGRFRRLMVVLVVGLTGGIGSGKSTVAALLSLRGAVVIDADAIAHRIVEPGEPALAALVERFGSGILDAVGRLDRKALAALAFADDGSRRDLEEITHPAIGVEFLRQVSEVPADSVVVHDVPLLVESGIADRYAAVIVVEAPREVRLERLESRGIDRADAAARMEAQATDAARRAVATWVIDNGGDLESLERQVEAIWVDLRTRRP